MKALITGATGFIGGALAKELAQRNWQVTATGRNLRKGEELRPWGIDFCPASLEEREKIIGLCQGKDVVFHSGALSSPWGRYVDFYQSNVLGTRNVIAGCLEHGVGRLVHVSSPGLYFNYRTRWEIREEDAFARSPINAYTETKLIAERSVDRAFIEGLAVVTLRPRAVFGPGDNAILPRVIRALREKRLPRIGSPDTIMDLSYIDNVVEALILASVAPGVLGKKYNITNDSPVKIWPLIEHIAKELGYSLGEREIPASLVLRIASIVEGIHRTCPSLKEPNFLRYNIGVLTTSMTFDIRAAKEDLSYCPQVGIEEGLEKFIDWWKKCMPR